MYIYTEKEREGERETERERERQTDRQSSERANPRFVGFKSRAENSTLCIFATTQHVQNVTQDQF